MPLPLMPGTEPVQAFVPPVPKPETPKRAGLYDNSGAVHGCNCLMCERSRNAGLAIAPRTNAFAATYSAGPPSIWNLPRDYPEGHPPGLVRGTYDFGHRADNRRDEFGCMQSSGLQGQVRWLNVRTGECFNLQGERQWKFSLSGGVWADRNGTRFIPDTPAPPGTSWDDIDLYANSGHPSAPCVEQSGVNAGRWRGRYDPQHRDARAFRGALRWLDAATGSLYSAAGERTNTVKSVQGVWLTQSGLPWVPV